MRFEQICFFGDFVITNITTDNAKKHDQKRERSDMADAYRIKRELGSIT